MFRRDKAAPEGEAALELDSCSAMFAKNFPNAVANMIGRKLDVDYELFSFVLCKPISGRTHQIRVHMKSLGHALVGD